MNILKSSALIENSEYQKLYRHFNFEKIWNNLFSGITKYRNFRIELNDESIIFTPNPDFTYLNNIKTLSNLLSKEDISKIILNNEQKSFKISQKKKILTYLHIDWILSLQHLKTNYSKELIEYLVFETNNTKLTKYSNNTEYRSNIYTTNKNSVIIDLTDDKNSQNISKLSNDNYKLILNNPLISFIEISNGFDNDKLNQFLNHMNKFCNKVVERLNKENLLDFNDLQKFSLKIRKIKRTYKRGMFIANQNTIIVDPRYVDSFIHELGHWYHIHFLPKITNECEAEKFAEHFEDYIK